MLGDSQLHRRFKNGLKRNGERDTPKSQITYKQITSKHKPYNKSKQQRSLLLGALISGHRSINQLNTERKYQMNLFGETKEEAAAAPTPFKHLFVYETGIDCIRYGEKSAGFLTTLPVIDVAKFAKYAYSVIMRFEDNFCESFQDEQGVWQTRGKGRYSLTTPLYNRLRNQATAAMAFTDGAFKSDTLTTERLQAVLDYVQGERWTIVDGNKVLIPVEKINPVTSTEGVKFSEQEIGMKEYITFQTNVAIGQATRIFKATNTRTLKKSDLSVSIIDDLVNLELFEVGQMPVDPTPIDGEIVTFLTNTTNYQETGQLEVQETDLYTLQQAQKNLGLWWNMFDRGSDKRELVEIMVTEAREFIAEKQKNPTEAGFVMADSS